MTSRHCMLNEVICLSQKLFKQGISDLKSQQYQLLYVDDGVLHGPELEDWKVLKATETY